MVEKKKETPEERKEKFLLTLLLCSMVREAGDTTMGISNEIRHSPVFTGVDWDSIATMTIGEGIILTYRMDKKIYSSVITVDKDLGLKVIGGEVVI